MRNHARRNDLDPGEALAVALPLVDEAVAVSIRAGLVDDAAYARARAATLRRRGWPVRRIQAALQLKGVPREEIAAALGTQSEEDEVGAAQRFAERRRLGPWRLTQRAEKRQKDVAALIRAGFSARLARRTIEGGT